MKSQPKPKSNTTDRIYATLTALLGSGAFIFLFMILGVLLVYAYPSEVVNGFNFFVSSKWSVPGDTVITVHGFPILQGAAYGVFVTFVGTLMTSAMALVIGVPVSLGIAILLTQYAPKVIASPISFAVELLAGIPSIIYGFWGLRVLEPVLKIYVEPPVVNSLGSVTIFQVRPIPGLLASGLILALMIVPIVASITRDAMAQTPRELTEGGTALGMTRWEVTRKITLPFAKTAIIGAVILGLGRALGETMAVAMVSGGANFLPNSIFGTINTMAAFLALNYGDVSDASGFTIYALAELALLLLATTMVVNVAARVLVRRGFFSSNAEHVIQV